MHFLGRFERLRGAENLGKVQSSQFMLIRCRRATLSREPQELSSPGTQKPQEHEFFAECSALGLLYEVSVPLLGVAEPDCPGEKPLLHFWQA